MMRGSFVGFVALLAVLDCSSDDGADTDLCGAASLQGLLGQPFSEADFDASARIIRPNMAVTQDFRLDRLNVELDEDDVITKIACG